MSAVATERPIRRLAVDLGALVLLLGVSIVGFWPTFGGPSYLGAAIGAMVLGLGVAVVGAMRGWGILLITGATIATYFLFGGALALPHTTIAGFIPTGETLGQLTLGVVTSWKQLLTTIAPVAAQDGHLLVPFLLTLTLSVLAGSLGLRLRTPAWALLPLGAFLVMVIALGVSQPALPVAQGVVFAIVAIAWLALRRIWAPSSAAVAVGQADPTRAAHMRRRRLVAGLAVLVVAGGAGVATSAIAAPQQPRHVIRDVIIPPFNIRDYPSPLQGYRKYLRDEKTAKLFTVSGLPKGARVRVAAMDEFSGQVYNVSGAGVGSSGAFTPLRSNMAAEAKGVPTTLKVEIGKYSSVWVPSAGFADSIEFSGARADELRRTTYYNDSTGTGVATLGLTGGDAYMIETVLPGAFSDKQLAEVPFGSVVLPKQKNVPEEFSAIAAEIVAESRTPIEQARDLETYFAEGGFFSHGLEGEVLSRAGHTAERIATLIAGQQMVGDDEQYAVAMALMAREVGIPARVVMGFYPDSDKEGEGSFTATGDDLHAWVEINFQDIGWVTFDPTPPEDKVPNDQTTKPKADPKPQVLQPPPPPQEPVDLPPTLPDDREGEDENLNIIGIIGLILLIAAISLLVLAVLAAPFVVIGAWKAAKRRKRRQAERTSDRISGGWDEFTDRAIDYGARLPRGATRSEEAAYLVGTLQAPAVTTLARRADASVFGPEDPSGEDVDEFWNDVDSAVAELGTGKGRWARIRARLNLRSVISSGGLSRRVQTLREAATARIRREPGTIKSNTPSASESESP